MKEPIKMLFFRKLKAIAFLLPTNKVVRKYNGRKNVGGHRL